MKVRFGFTMGPEVPAGGLGPLVDDLERLDFDSLWIPEVMSMPILDPIVGLAFAAARTRRLKLGCHLVLPGRHPVQLARQLAHLDRVSEGRLLLLGVLGLRRDADHGLQGVDPGDRGAVVDEMVPLLRELWSGETVSHEGRYFQFSDVVIDPTPVQEPLELWLGGQAPSALRRCASFGEGWMPGLVPPKEGLILREQLEVEAAAIGRTMDPEHFGANLFYAREPLSTEVVEAMSVRRSGVDIAAVTPVGPEALRERIEEWIEAGFSKFLLRPVVPPSDWTEELEGLAEEVLPLTT
ncbi:MAG: LLM class flavin-dependent oxidoreductase [Acidimicrobiales bacterium]